MPHLRSISVPDDVKGLSSYPFNVPAVRALTCLELTSPVTFLVGENGSGKSTLLEAIAAGIEMIAVGAEDVRRDESLAAARRLGDRLRFTWSKRTRRGFFLRAEDFFSYAKRVKAMRSEL